MRALVLHPDLPADARADSLDVLDQVEAVVRALRSLGFEVHVAAVGLDLGELDRALARARPDVAFNLVEELAGSGRLAALVPLFLRARNVPCTGASVEALTLADDKLRSKARFVELGLPTSPWRERHGTWRPGRPDGRVIVKSVHEHGSLGLEADLVVGLDDEGALDDLLARAAGRLGGSSFAEGYVHGRELNVGVLETADGVRCLPPAEIEFLGLPEGAPRVVGYRAKWSPGSTEYEGTPRKAVCAAEDAPLIARLQALALAAFRGFGLAGYGRVDFRVDGAGAAFLLEVNANPCLSPDAGFAAALAQAGIDYAEAIGHVVERARRGSC